MKKKQYREKTTWRQDYIIKKNYTKRQNYKKTGLEKEYKNRENIYISRKKLLIILKKKYTNKRLYIEREYMN